MADLRNKLLGSVVVATPEDSAAFFKNGVHDRWGETLTGEDSPIPGKTLVYVNDGKFVKHGAAEDYRDKAVLGEALHMLKAVDPDRWNRMRLSALKSPEYLNWTKNSYQRSVAEGEKRPFEKWHDVSRFDQVIGGYLFAKDPAFPSMADWSRTDMPYGKELVKELEQLRKDLDIE